MEAESRELHKGLVTGEATRSGRTVGSSPWMRPERHRDDEVKPPWSSVVNAATALDDWTEKVPG